MQKTFAVTGGSRSYGADITNALRGEDHIVYDIQRHIRPHVEDLFDPQLELDHWISCDFSAPHQIVETATYFLENKIMVDGLVHAAAHRDELDHRLISTLDMKRHFDVNVFGPILLSVYFKQANVMRPGSRIVFLLDGRILPKENITYCASKAAIKPSMEAMKSLCEDIDIFYVIMPDRDSEQSLDADKKVRQILTGDISPKGDVILI